MEGINIATYNCRGLPKRRQRLALRPDIIDLMNNNHIIALQEIWYSKQNLNLINSLHDEFDGFGAAKIDESENVVQGRYSGGVAFMWRKELSKHVKRINLDVDWCLAIEISMEDTKFTLFNVYMPYQIAENEDKYIESLGYIKACLDENACTNFAIIGDWNANLGTSGNNIFKSHMSEFCSSNSLNITSLLSLPQDTYTHIHTREGNTYHSWLDHIVTSIDMHNSIRNIEVLYSISDEDHIPVRFGISVANMPKITSINNNHTPRIHWNGVSNDKISKYHNNTSAKFDNVNIPVDTICCGNIRCTDISHTRELEIFYNDITNGMQVSGEHLSTNKNKYSHKPGWSEYVSDLYEFSRETYRVWLDNNKPRQGPIHDIYTQSKRRFKYALRLIKKNEDALRKEALAKKLSNLNPAEFWREVASINNSNVPLPSSIGDATGADNIVTLWKNHFYSIFNCISNAGINLSDYDSDTPYDMIKVSIKDIQEAIKKLDCNKSCGSDQIYAEHLKHASDKLLPLLAMCITGFFVHGFLPKNIMNVVLIPIIKNKAGNINSVDNYRPIALASILSKVIEIIILSRIETYLVTQANQFGFKRRHGTDQGIYVLKEIVSLYTSLKGSVFACFLDATKAFDRVNHVKLFQKLAKRGVPGYIIKLLLFWYLNQTMCIKWGNTMSDLFNVTNGVRQGGILSPYLFNVYLDDLSTELNSIRVGCIMGEMIINHILYADDLVLISPSTRGLDTLIKCCEKYGIEHNIIFNVNKCAVMHFKSDSIAKFKVPDFILNGETIELVTEFKYLGHILTSNMKDDKDIERQRRKLFIQGNTLIRKFYMCTFEVKIELFRSYCSAMYTPHLWTKYSVTAIRKLYTAYHNSLKILIGVSKREETSPLCVSLNVKSCPAVIRNLVFKFMTRLKNSENNIITAICGTSCMYKSPMWMHWRRLLYVNA